MTAGKPNRFIHSSQALAGRQHHSGRYSSASKHPVASVQSDSIDVISPTEARLTTGTFDRGCLVLKRIMNITRRDGRSLMRNWTWHSTGKG